jgi:hypothetical protein
MRRFTGLLLGLSILVPASLAQETRAMLETLPTGQYYYVRKDTPPQTQAGYVLLRKTGRTVIGVDGRIQAQPVCFRGFIAANQITHATRVYPPYQPDSRWEVDRDVMVELSTYEQVDRSPTAEQLKTLQTCIQYFWR